VFYVTRFWSNYRPTIESRRVSDPVNFRDVLKGLVKLPATVYDICTSLLFWLGSVAASTGKSMMAALLKEWLRMRLLKITGADFSGRNVRSNCERGHPRATPAVRPPARTGRLRRLCL
jgi:hypothetical protein